MTTYTTDVTQYGTGVSSTAFDHGVVVADSGVGSSAVAPDWYMIVNELMTMQQTVATAVSAGVAVGDGATAQSSIMAALLSVVADTANVTAQTTLESTVLLADLMVAAGLVDNRLSAVSAIADAAVALTLAGNFSDVNVAESAAGTTAVAQYATYLAGAIESAVAATAAVSYLAVVKNVADTGVATTAVDTTATLIQAIQDGATIFIRLMVSGEEYTGWVMNADTMAFSEYQGLTVNSMCQHGGAFLAAMDGGIYEMVGADDDGEGIVAYLKTGKMDFDSPQLKRMAKAYLAYTAAGDVLVKVVTTEGRDQQQEYWYKLAATGPMESMATGRLDIGLGLRSRYWQFELVADAAGIEIDELGLTPVAIKRRV